MTTVKRESDITFAEVDGAELALDIYRPDCAGPVPVVLYLHGGGWQVGDKGDAGEERLAAAAAYGIAVASANYRFASQATFPSQLHDVRAAVRWLRAHGAERGLATAKIGVWGASAGAVLASLAGLAVGNPELDGAVGDDLGVSGAVGAVVDWFGQSDVIGNSRRSWLEKQILPPPFEGPWLGLADPADDPALARLASPLHHVAAGAPPFLIVHGDRDRVTPASESLALHDALTRAGSQSTLVLLGGAGHEGADFDRPDNLRMTAAFLLEHLSAGETA